MGAAFGTALSQPIEVFVVGQKRSATAGNRYLLDGASSAQTVIRSYQGNWNTYAGSDLDDGAENTDPHLWMTRFDGGSSIIEVDQSQTASGNAGTQGMDGWTLGARADRGANGDFDVCAVAVYDPTANEYSRSDVQTYLANKYGPF